MSAKTLRVIIRRAEEDITRACRRHARCAARGTHVIIKRSRRGRARMHAPMPRSSYAATAPPTSNIYEYTAYAGAVRYILSCRRQPEYSAEARRCYAYARYIRVARAALAPPRAAPPSSSIWYAIRIAAAAVTPRASESCCLFYAAYIRAYLVIIIDIGETRGSAQIRAIRKSLFYAGMSIRATATARRRARRPSASRRHERDGR